MLGMSAAPTQSPLPATVASPASEPQAASVTPGSDATQNVSPFASVLGQQMTAQAEQAAPVALDAAVVTALDASETVAEAPTDAISVLASMLNGIAPASPETGKTIPDGEQAATETAIDPAAMAATAAAPVAAPVIPTTGVAAKGAKQELPASESRTMATAAIVAAGTGQGKEAAAETGKTGADAWQEVSEAGRPAMGADKPDAGKPGSGPTNFSDLLDAARSTQATAVDGSTATKMAAAELAAAGAARAAAPGHAGNAASASVTATIATPVGAEGWNREVGEKLSWMVGRQETRADLILNPPELGRIEVSLSLNGDRANASFVSANPAVREALENAMPHLRETLQSAGISLGQTQVGAESFQQAANQGENGDNSRRGGNADDGKVAGAATGGETTPAWLRRGNGLVDTFA